jgi:cell wall-associated NlpC family hydrolase
MIITRQQIIQAATSFLGTPFRHQGRSADFLDCGGHLKLVGERLGVELKDIEAYKFPVDSKQLLDCLRSNFIEIDVSEVLPGDIYAMKVHGLKVRHIAFKYSDTRLIHSVPNRGVVIDSISHFRPHQFALGFRFKEVV